MVGTLSSKASFNAPCNFCRYLSLTGVFIFEGGFRRFVFFNGGAMSCSMFSMIFVAGL